MCDVLSENIISHFADVSFSLSGHLHKNALSSPIHIDNVACYGAEAKLIDCSYQTDTSEDDHSEDIWVHCLIIECPDSSLNKDTTISQQQSSSSALSAVALTMALAICMVVVTVVIVYVVLRHIKQRKNQHSNERYKKLFCVYIAYN